MKYSDDLFQLIKSLDKSEKRYFRLFSSLHGSDKKYMLVFDAIDKQKQYDEKKITDKFQKENFIRQFHVIKHYLYNLIMRSMDVYHYSINAELRSSIHQAEILFEKGLYKQCEKIIRKAKPVAVKHEKHLPWLELVSWEIRLAGAQSFFGKTKQEIENSYKELFAVNQQWRNFYEYCFLGSQIGIIAAKKGGNIRTSSEQEFYKNIMRNSLLQNENKALSYLALYRFYHCHGTYSFACYDNERAYEYALQSVNLFEQHPELKKEYHWSYKEALSNLISCQLSLEKYREIPSSLDKLKALPMKSGKGINEMFYWINIVELSMCNALGDFDKGIQFIEGIKHFLEKEKRALNKQYEIILYAEIACVYFGKGDYAVANKWLNELLNEPQHDMREDIYCIIRIVQLLVHFEMNKRDLLEYTVKSAYRFLYKKKRLYKFETIVLRFIRKDLPKIYSEKELIPALKKVKTEIEEVIKNPFERKALDYFDFISWLESKIEGRAFAEVVREKAGSPS